MSPLPEVIALGGHASAGKDSVANVLVERYGYTRVAFGDPVRALLEEMNPLIATAEGPVNLAWILKGVGWDVAKREHSDLRRLMQHLGNGAREHTTPDVWVQAALRKAEGHPRVVYSDVRYRNELDAVSGPDSCSLWISRPGNGPLNGHVSETQLSRLDFDFGVFNEDELEDLADEVGLFMSEIFGVEA
jgi:hypothetical protein